MRKKNGLTNKIYGFVIIVALIGLFLVGFYFNLQARKADREYKDDYIKECFDQNYPDNFDSPEEVYKGCKKLYDKEGGY